VLDTRHFDEDFTARLVATIENLDEKCDGLLVHSENFQALNSIEQRTSRQVSVVYTDPPYNTGNDGFAYRDGYQRSSWLAMISQTFGRVRATMTATSSAWVSIDDHEVESLKAVLPQCMSPVDFLAHVLWQKRYAPDIRTAISDAHEHILVFGSNYESFKKHRSKLPLTDKQTDQFNNSDKDENGAWKSADFTAQGYRPNQMYPIELPSGRKVTPPPGRCWATTEENFLRLRLEGRIYFPSGGDGRPGVKRYLKDMDGMVPWTWWDHNDVGHSQKGMKVTMDLFDRDGTFLTAKPPTLIERCIRIGSSSIGLILDFFAGSGTTGHAVINLNREDNGNRKYILIEMGDHFDTVLKPRIAKVVYSPDWKDGKPVTRDKGISHCFKYIRLESYEDTLNNLRFVENKTRDEALKLNEPLRRDYTLNYLLDVETRGSQSLLNIDAFTDPAAYTLKVKKSGATGSVEQAVDLIETFNFLIGLRVIHLAAPQRFAATFKRVPDPDLPKGTDTRLQLDGKMKQSADGAWWFRKVEGWVPKDRENPNNGQKETVLIVWRTLTGNLEEDNLMLDEWFQKNRLSTRDFEFDTIYVNGSNNLPNLKLDTDTWKVRLLKEEFHKMMWDVQDI
jgi:adenine-specific DNA-methyltransferase